MKTIFKLLVVMTATVLYSCSNTLNTEEFTVNSQEGVEVPISFNGDILQSEEPLTRAANSTNDLLGIQVYRRTAGTTYSWNAFAYGLFDHLDNLSVYLLKGYEYKVVATLVKDGKIVLYNRNGDYGYYYDVRPNYLHPFNAGSIFVNASNRLIIAASPYYFSGLENCSATLSNGSDVTKYPPVDRLYGQVEGVLPTNNTQININLKRVSFGLSCSVNGLEEGTLNVKVKNADKTFYDLTNLNNGFSTGTSFYTFTNMVSGAYEHWNSYYENLTVSVTHKHSIGITEDLGCIDVKVYRNKVNNIKINLNATTTRTVGCENGKINVIVEQEDIK